MRRTSRMVRLCWRRSATSSIPAALEDQITVSNAPKIRAPVIAEAANGPVTSAASEYLNGQGKVLIPDVYLNAGGVTVSYFEWISLRDFPDATYGVAGAW